MQQLNPPSSARPRAVSRSTLVGWIAAAGFVLASTCMLIRLTLRDWNEGIALLFYAGQPALITLGFTVVAIVWRRRRRLALTAAMLALASGAIWLARDLRVMDPYYPATASSLADHSAQADSPKLRAVTWNIAGGSLGLSAVRAAVRSFDADIVALVEAPMPIFEAYAGKSPLPAGYDHIATPSGLALCVRGSIPRYRLHKHRDHTRVLEADVVIGATELTVLVVDVPGNVLMSRSGPLAHVLNHVRRLRGRPLLVLGDFNTPPDSRYFDDYRPLLVNAFEAAGTGYGPTWPTPAPVLPIDQIWASPKLRIDRCMALWTRLSDHRPVWVEFAPVSCDSPDHSTS